MSIPNFKHTYKLIDTLNSIMNEPSVNTSHNSWTKGMFLLKETHEDIHTSNFSIQYVFKDEKIEPLSILKLRLTTNFIHNHDAIDSADHSLYQQFLLYLIAGNEINFPVMNKSTTINADSGKPIIMPSIRKLILGGWEPFEVNNVIAKHKT